MKSSTRFRSALKVSGLHLLCSLVVALASALLVLGFWFPHPYQELSGGRELFFLIIVVDVICGPLLTFVLFSPIKSRRELWADLGLVVLLQAAALGYGMWTSWQARPLYLVLEVDRFKVVMAADIDHEMLKGLPAELQPIKFGGVRNVAVRRPANVDEKNKVFFEAIEGGRDYAERPEFYIPYEGVAALASLKRAKPLEPFLQKYPEQKALVDDLIQKSGIDFEQLKLLPVVGRQDWVALLNKQGKIQGFVKGDGF